MYSIVKTLKAMIIMSLSVSRDRQCGIKSGHGTVCTIESNLKLHRNTLSFHLCIEKKCYNPHINYFFSCNNRIHI